MTQHPGTTRKLRALHRALGIAGAPWIIVTAIGGGLLLLRKTGLYERKGAFRELVQSLHNFELILPYVGLLACGLMLLLATTGLVLVVRTRRPRRSPPGSAEPT